MTFKKKSSIFGELVRPNLQGAVKRGGNGNISESTGLGSQVDMSSGLC